MKTLIKEETLDRMFDNDSAQKHVKQTGRCCSCESDVEIVLRRTSKGYGLQGGLLYETMTGQFLLQCERCFKNFGFLDHHKGGY